MPTNAQYEELIEKVRADFKKEFNYDITEDDSTITRCDDGIEIDYRDYDLNMFPAYNHSSLVESPRIENDGRCEYVKVYSYIQFEDYL